MDTHVKHQVGESVGRFEDDALLRGTARFTDDIQIDAPLHACFLRSPHPHARILSIDSSMAREMAGVAAVYTGADFAAVLTTLRMPLGFPSLTLPPDITPFVLAPHEVCFVGEALVMVVAESRAQAEDAAALVMVDYDVLPAVSDCRAAVADGAPRVRSEITSNVLQRYTLAYGECGPCFDQAAHIVADDFWVHRGCAHSMEGRAVLAHHDRATQTLNVWSSTQMAHELHHAIALMLGQPEDRLRVMCPDVGGGFGAKFMIYPEEIAVPAAARLLGRPVKWIEDRREHFTSSIQERDQYWHAEMAVDAQGRILAVRAAFVHDHGAYTPQGTNVPYNSASSLSGPYIVPALSVDVTLAHTNKVPVATIRGAGYPQSNFVMERLIDRAADSLSIDRAECRRRNLIPPEKIPYTKPLVSRAGAPLIIDSGDFPTLQARLLDEMQLPAFRERQQAARRAGRYLGIGLANAVKPTGRGPFESARVRVMPSGRVAVYTGAMAMGQGLKTSLAQICADALGMMPADIEVTAGDTSFVSFGMGGFASRQAIMAGSAVYQAANALRSKAIDVAAALLGVEAGTLTLRDGTVMAVAQPGPRISLARLATELKGAPGFAMPLQSEPGLDVTSHFHCDAQTYASCSHGCEVEVDALTGVVEITRYVAVHDSGRIINPQIAEGQVHGGVVHAIGNALYEWMGYDDGAQPVTTTLAEYLLPTAPEMPDIKVIFLQTPSPLNPLGVKGIGEVAALPVAAAIAAAVDDALASFGVHVAEAPLTPVRLLELIDAAQVAAS